MKAKIEFRQDQKRRTRGWGFDIQFHVEDIMAFLEWCNVSEMDIKRVKYHLGRKRKKKPVSIYKHTKYDVYPHDNMISKYDVGIHYICQHAFDILPENVNTSMHNFLEGIDEDRQIGTLYPHPNTKAIYPDVEESYPVMNSDIVKGFALGRQGVNKYHDNFTFFVIEQHKKRDARKKQETD